MTTTAGSRLEAGPGTPLTAVNEARDGPLNQAYVSNAEWGPIFEVPSHPLAPERAERDSQRCCTLEQLRIRSALDMSADKARRTVTSVENNEQGV
jgi:hypothetical protein